MAPLKCTALVPGTTDTAYTYGTVVARILSSDDNSATVLSGRDKALIWTLTMGSNPQLASPIDLSAEVTTPSVNAVCFDAVPAELGTLVVNNMTYGTGRDLVVACHLTPSGSKSSMLAVFARYASADGSSAQYVQMFALSRDPSVSLGVGDFNGDGVDDVIYTTGVQGQGTIHLRLQCDTHDVTCKRGGS
jgi:hypothetical protein